MPTTISDTEAEALGRRWQAACGQWWQAWRPGMLWRVTHSRNEGRISDVSPGAVNFRHYMPPGDPGPWPDLRDAATRGAALEVVRERWGAPALQVSPVVATQPDGVPTGIVTAWRYYVNDPEEHFGHAATEPEALVAALEARHAL